MNRNSQLLDILREIVTKKNFDTSKIELLPLEDQELIKNLQSNGLLEEALLYLESIDADKNWEELQVKLNLEKKSVVINWRNVFQYAAMFFCLLGLVYVFQYKAGQQNKAAVSPNAIQLVLENGDIQVLNPNGEQQIIKKNGEVVASQKENEINYHSAKSMNKLVYNEIKIPYGKTFKITLSDGTLVNMNAGSSLKYPVQFIKGHNREVALDGEAFFDVAKDKAHPFIVKTAGQEIKVLGTHFNVNCYADEPQEKTTLLEGSIAAHAIATKSSHILAPGNQAILYKGGLKILQVDTTEMVAWKNGYFKFNNETIESIMRTLSRWYNIEITYQANVQDERFTGRISRYKNIAEVLNLIASDGTIKFKAEGRRIMLTH